MTLPDHRCRVCGRTDFGGNSELFWPQNDLCSACEVVNKNDMYDPKSNEDIFEMNFRSLISKLAQPENMHDDITITASERQLLVMRLKRSIDIYPIIDTFAKLLARTMISWKEKL